MSDTRIEALKRLREPFADNLISKLPKPTKFHTDSVKKDFKNGARCNLCGGWHHPDVIHLDYVGHAALTDRLLDVDPLWDWEPIARDENSLPLIVDGGMWITLTVCGMTRKGYGDAQDKKGHNAIKEIIGDALRNAGMRFGMGLDLWHKGNLHVEDDTEEKKKETKTQKVNSAHWEEIFSKANPQTLAAIKAWCSKNGKNIKATIDPKESGKFKAFLDQEEADYAPKKKTVKEEIQADRTKIDEWLQWILQHKEKTIDQFTAAWEAHGEKQCDSFPGNWKKEMLAARDEVIEHLTKGQK